MKDVLYTALAAFLVTAIGWLTTWLKSKTKSKVIEAVTTAIENVDNAKVKEEVEKLAVKTGVSVFLDKILAKLGFLGKSLPVLLLCLLAGCGLLSSGATGSVPEGGMTTVSSDPEINIDVEGSVPPGGISIVITYGEKALTGDLSTGGGNAGPTGGGGPVTPTVNLTPGAGGITTPAVPK